MHFTDPVMVSRLCKYCGKPFKARLADVKRGWGLFDSKSCKASYQAIAGGRSKKARLAHTAQKQRSIAISGNSFAEYDVIAAAEDSLNHWR
jgi:hypothetical protein